MPEDVRTKCVYITCIIRVNGRRIPRFHRYGIERSQEETLWFRGEAGDILFFFVVLKIFFFFSSNLLQEISNGVNVKKLLNIWLSTTNASEIIFFISVLVGMQKKKKKISMSNYIIPTIVRFRSILTNVDCWRTISTPLRESSVIYKIDSLKNCSIKSNVSRI